MSVLSWNLRYVGVEVTCGACGDLIGCYDPEATLMVSTPPLLNELLEHQRTVCSGHQTVKEGTA